MTGSENAQRRRYRRPGNNGLQLASPSNIHLFPQPVLLARDPPVVVVASTLGVPCPAAGIGRSSISLKARSDHPGQAQFDSKGRNSSDNPCLPLAVGDKDSSATRVRPAFEALDERSDHWLESLWALGSRATGTAMPADGEWAGRLIRPPQFEHECLSPHDYLRYLIDHAGDADLIDHSKLDTGRLGAVTRDKRTALFQGDPVVRREAHDRLAGVGGRRPRGGQWHVLEGVTKVDCALFAENVTLFVEGKRTEPKLTDKTPNGTGTANK